MADLSDVTTYLRSAVTAAVYPNGTTNPSVIAPMDVRVAEGWPLPDQLDRDMSGTMLVPTSPAPVPRPNGPCCDVSIFPMNGNTATPFQILDETYVISQPVYGLTVTVVGELITLSGTPGAGEYITIIADKNNVYSRSGPTAAVIISSLVADISANYPGVTSTSLSLTIPYSFGLVVRQGGVGVLGKVVHRQRQSVMVTVWAPNRIVRSKLSAAIDVALKSNIRITLPDTSQAIVCYSRTNTSDDKQAATIYRRDLIYDIEYATVEEFPGYVVTSVNGSIINFNNSSVIPAIT